MASSGGATRVEGIVQPCFLDSICLSHRVCIVASDGRVYEVEPNYVGLYLERFVGHHVVARVKPVTNGKRRSVVRILSLKVLDTAARNADAGPESVKPQTNSTGQDLACSDVEFGSPTS